MAKAGQATTTFPLSLSAFMRLPMRFKLAAMVGVAVAIAVIVGVSLWARQPDYAVLFSNLSDRDGGEIVATLQQQNVPYQYSEGGGAILVPSNMVHDIRLRLASQGLPKGGLVGFEVMENQKLGASQFLEQINYQRALEGELARTISTISAVKGARVHLAIPKQTAFLRDEQKPTASVLVNLQPGRTLDGAQIAGIVHLISSSVPELAPASVSVVDQEGSLISQQNDALRQTGLDPAQLKYVRDIESGYIKRIEAIVVPIVGAGNVKAQITADVDFSQTEQVAETYRPNPSPETAVRSQQVSESGAGGPNAVGVPGALTNQPPAPATAQITTPPAPGTPGGAGTGNAQSAQNYSRNSTVNYEVDKTVSHTRMAPGVVRRLSIALLVNQKQEPGKPKAVPLSDAEIKQITALAKEAVGFNQQRGDTLNVTNAAFNPGDKDVLPQTPIWKDPFLLATLKDIGRYIAAIVVAWLVWTRLFRPLFRRLAEIRPPSPAEEEVFEESEGSRHAARNFEAKIGYARDVAKQDPKIVAGLIKEWVGGNESR
jgi:flagellar M-ring protein FliF